MALLYHHFENGCFMADSQTVLDIRDDLGATMNECREVTEKYRTGRSAYLRLGLHQIKSFSFMKRYHQVPRKSNLAAKDKYGPGIDHIF